MRNGSCCETPKTEQKQQDAAFRPSVDIVETAEEFRIYADIPGATTESIDIQFEEGTLSISAKAPNRVPANAKVLLKEYGIGDYHRSFRVSESIDAAKIAADFQNGVVVLHLPKSEPAKLRRIPVVAS